MEKIQGIYQIKNTINGKVYVGQVCRRKGVKRRFTEHINSLKRNNHHNRHLQNSWNKYGEDCFSFDIIEEVLETNKLDDREQFWLDKTWDYSYNIQPVAGGSCLGKKHSNETKLKIGQANSRRVWTELSKRKLSESQKGKKMSAETCEKMRLSHIGMKHTAEIKSKISKSHKGKTFSDETKRKISESKLGTHPTKESIEKKMLTCRKLSGKGLYKGIRKRTSRWQARINIDGKELSFGNFDSDIEAAMNYDYHVIALFGKGNSFINFPDYDYDTFVPKKQL